MMERPFDRVGGGGVEKNVGRVWTIESGEITNVEPFGTRNRLFAIEKK